MALGEASAAAASYPAAMAWALAQALLRIPATISLYTAPGFRVGSAKPHATDAIAEAAFEQAKAATSGSLRRLEPEREEVLRDEPFPEVNTPVN